MMLLQQVTEGRLRCVITESDVITASDGRTIAIMLLQEMMLLQQVTA